MDIETRKETAKAFMLALDAGDAEFVRSHISDDFHVQFMDQTPIFESGGDIPNRMAAPEFLAGGVPLIRSVTVDGMHFVFTSVVAEGDEVVIFGKSDGQTVTGRAYRNVYAWRIVFSGDKIIELNEFCDTHLARNIIFSMQAA
ncbi:nuclear transport factor 2 family protein [Sphingobium sp. DEHP117]|uniref:nuclear transport factor 2 family protein n=1 Tax=Sphingobium sp. DEHP117 TaxID=2993436 RepID=UPI0027D4FB9E|nr:nuclear transport factor 2 family protein [Sphingobium sp. DEHP117]MDQ4420358.1 nuclear transport factor 2 family protein [Sphingobium sp. DEHP117]